MSDSPPKKSPGEQSVYDSDEDALDQFCNDFDLEHIEFDTWCESNHCLDLLVPVRILLTDLPESREWQVTFTRTVRWRRPDGTVGERQEKISLVAKIPVNCSNGDCLELVGEGDHFDDQKGTLKLRICIS